MSELTLLFKTQHPPASAVLKLKPETSLNDARSEGAKALKIELKEFLRYAPICVPYGEDVIELEKVDGKKSLKEAGVQSQTTLFFAAPADLKPVIKVLKVKKEEEDEDEKKKKKKKTAGPAKDRYKSCDKKTCITEYFNSSTSTSNKTILGEYIDIYFTELSESADFLALSADQVKQILASDFLNASEGDVFNGLVNWGKKKIGAPATLKSATSTSSSSDKESKLDCAALKAAIKDLLPTIRFPLFTSQEVANLLVPLDLLETKQVLSIYSYIAARDSKAAEEEDESDKKKKKKADSNKGMDLKELGLDMFSDKERVGRMPPDWFCFADDLKHTQLQLTDDGLTVSSNSTSYYCAIGSDVEFEDGVHEWEFEILQLYSHQYGMIVGVAPADWSNWQASNMLGYSGHIPGWGYGPYDGQKWFNGQLGAVTKAKVKDIVHIKLDLDKGEMSVAVDSGKTKGKYTVIHKSITGPVRPLCSFYGTNSLKLGFPK